MTLPFSVAMEADENPLIDHEQQFDDVDEDNEESFEDFIDIEEIETCLQALEEGLQNLQILNTSFQQVKMHLIQIQQNKQYFQQNLQKSLESLSFHLQLVL